MERPLHRPLPGIYAGFSATVISTGQHISLAIQEFQHCYKPGCEAPNSMRVEQRCMLLQNALGTTYSLLNCRVDQHSHRTFACMRTEVAFALLQLMTPSGQCHKSCHYASLYMAGCKFSQAGFAPGGNFCRRPVTHCSSPYTACSRVNTSLYPSCPSQHASAHCPSTGSSISHRLCRGHWHLS